jgi:arylsulfatase A-like enzyme
MDRSARPNVLLVTLDQLRADALSCAGHPVVQTPALDAVTADGVRFARHYAQAAPCAPGRASLYTGQYQMNHRVVANGTPLDHRFDNVARAARRAGYDPTLFGYTDHGVDPRTVAEDDPWLRTYEGILPGFRVGLHLPSSAEPWLDHLRRLGFDVRDADHALATEPDRPAECSQSAFLTDAALTWLADQNGPWFAHLSYLRPHPPYAAAGVWSHRYDPADCGTPLPVPDHRTGLHDALRRHPELAAPDDPVAMRQLRAQYYGMVSEADAQLGRVLDAIRARGEWDRTIVVVTADHGEQLGDQGLVQKAGWFESSYHVPCLVRAPGRAGAGSVVDAFTEALDVFPTLCDLLRLPVPMQCDGRPLTPFLDGTTPTDWRDAAHWEWDFRDRPGAHDPLAPWDRRHEHQHLAVRRSRERAYVQFGNGSWLAYDLAADPTWGTPVADPATVLADAQAMLVWRAVHRDRTLSGVRLTSEGPLGAVGT